MPEDRKRDLMMREYLGWNLYRQVDWEAGVVIYTKGEQLCCVPIIQTRVGNPARYEELYEQNKKNWEER